MVVARAFGAGPVTDAFLRRVPYPQHPPGGSSRRGPVHRDDPVFTEYVARTSGPSSRMLRAVLGLALVALTVTTALGILGAPYILEAIAPGFMGDPAQASLAVVLTRIMFPYLLLVGLAAWPPACSTPRAGSSRARSGRPCSTSG